MDEQNACTREETCPSTELKAESSNLSAAESVREYQPCAEQIEPAHDQQTAAAGVKSCQQLADVASFARERVDGIDDNEHRKDVTSSHSIATQGCLQASGDAQDSRALPGCVKSSVHLDLNLQLHAPASAGTTMPDAVQVEQVDAGLKVVSAPDGRAPLAHVDCLQEADVIDSVQDSVDFVMDEGCHGEASLEMLSVAVESFENMQRQSEEGIKNASNFVENPGSGKEHAENDVQHEMEVDYNDKSSMTKSTSEDNESSVIEGTSAPRTEFQDKERFLNMLCELAAVHQQEGELSRMSKQVASCMTSLADNDVACGEPARLSFVDLLTKQMVHAGAFTDLTADAIYEEFLRQNPEFLENKVGKDLNLSMPSVGISSNEGAVATLEVEQKPNYGTSHREDDTPSTTQEFVGDSRSGEIKLLEKGGGDSKEETRVEENSFVVGDLVWAKVKSHPWWPGQIFDAADASVAAKKIQRPGRTLVAFFGDGTFGWLQQSQLIPFMPNFSEKVKQTTMKSFTRAVGEALDEVCRRMELGVRCSHSGDALYSPNLFPDLNAGIRKGVRLTCHQDIDVSTEMFQPESVLRFLGTAACSPLYSLRTGLEYSRLCGHVYGFRSFMLSPKRPESKVTLLNVVKAQKTEKSVHSSLLKRRLGVDEPGGVPNSAVGKQAKRLHLSKDAGMKEPSASGRVQSPRFRSLETLLSTEAEESKASESESKSPEQVKGSSWLAKGKRLQVSPDCKEKKSIGGWHSLGPLRDPKESGIKTTVDTSPDDDNKTLFDITGYHSLKKKRKGAPKSTDAPSKKVDQQLLGVKQELSNKQLVFNLDETREEEGGLPDSGISSVNIMVPQPDFCLSPVAKDFRNAEEGNKDTKDQLDLKDADSKDFMNVEKGNEAPRDPLDLIYADIEVSKPIKGEVTDSNVDFIEDSEKQERNPHDAKVDDSEPDEKVERELKVEVGDDFEKDQEKLEVGVAEKSQNEVLKVEQSERDEGELGVHKIVKKQTKRLHSEAGSTLRLSIKAKKRRQDTQDKVEVLLSSFSENKEIVPRKSVKTSKLGLSMRKVAGTLKGTPASLKSAKHISSEDGLSTPSIECEGGKDIKRPNLGYRSPLRQVPAAKKSANNESSLAKLLSILQVVATDPVSSANMRSSLEGVTSVFLKFRNMVFVKSSGYPARAAGKVMATSANGHLFGEKKVDVKGRSGRKSLLSETQQSGSKDSSLEPSKADSGSIVGPDSERISSGHVKAVAIKERHPLGATLDAQGSDAPNSSPDNERASGETRLHGKIMQAGNPRLCVQDLAVAARKRKFQVLQESAAKVLGKSEALKGLPEKLLVEKKFNRERVADTRLYAKSVKHHISKVEGLSYSEKRTPMQSSKVALGLFMQFPEDYTLPSETELQEVFKQFGTLEMFGIRVYKNDSTAQVVFKHSNDAEAAWQHARKNRMFGHANVSYKLRHFSLSSKSDSRLFSLASAKKEMKSLPIENLGRPSLAKYSTGGSEKGVPSIPSRDSAGDSLLNRAYVDKGSFSVSEKISVEKLTISECEPLPAHSPARESMASMAGPEGLRVVEQAPLQIGLSIRSEPVLAHSPASRLQPGSSTLSVPSLTRSPPSSGAEGSSVGPPVIYQQEAIQSPSSRSTLVTNFFNPPSVSNVIVSPGDIQDQMMKLLQQVSVIVSSTSLNPNNL